MGRELEEDALDCYERSPEAELAHLPARVNKGSSLLALSRLAESTALYTDILQELPQHTCARIGLARAAARRPLLRRNTAFRESLVQ